MGWVISAPGGAASGAEGWVPVAAQEVVGAAAATVDLLDLDPHDLYKVVFEYQIDIQAADEQILVHFNGEIVGTNYSSLAWDSGGTQAQTAANFMQLNRAIPSQLGWGVLEAVISNRAAVPKNLVGCLSMQDAGRLGTFTGAWANVSTLIDRITFSLENTSKFQVGSRAVVLGLTLDS